MPWFYRSVVLGALVRRLARLITAVAMEEGVPQATPGTPSSIALICLRALRYAIVDSVARGNRERMTGDRVRWDERSGPS